MLKELLDYLNTEIYPSMSAKRVKEIKEQSLGGGLMDMIKKYSQSEVLKAIEEKDKQHEIDIKSKDKLIERLRGGFKENEGKKYRVGSDKFNK